MSTHLSRSGDHRRDSHELRFEEDRLPSFRAVLSAPISNFHSLALLHNPLLSSDLSIFHSYLLAVGPLFAKSLNTIRFSANRPCCIIM